MAGHDAVGSGGDCRAERNQLQALEAFAVGVNDREVDVRISGGVAMTRKMFCRREAAIFLYAMHEGGHVLGNFLRIFAERTRVDDGIIRIVVYVGVRRVNPLDAY